MLNTPLNELFDLRGKTAIVTGAAQGMGRAIALRLAEAGANVLLTGRNAEGLQQSAKMIADSNGKADWILADMGNMQDLAPIVDKAITTFNSIDILVNCAGGAHPFTSALDVTEEVWNRTLDSNLKGNFFLSQEVAKKMVAAGQGGRIVNIASIAGVHPDPQLSDYNASKAGLISLTQSLAQEFGQHHILVNSVVPGPIMTPRSAPFYDMPEIQDIISQRSALGKVGESEDIANAVLFFVSRAAGHVTGSSLVVDGGMLVC